MSVKATPQRPVRIKVSDWARHVQLSTTTVKKRIDEGTIAGDRDEGGMWFVATDWADRYCRENSYPLIEVG